MSWAFPSFVKTTEGGAIPNAWTLNQVQSDKDLDVPFCQAELDSVLSFRA